MLERTPVDVVFINGRLYTMESPGKAVEALAVANGRIVARGSSADILAFAPGAKVVDCEGQTGIPGIIDSHCHPDMQGARRGRWHDFSDGAVTDREQLLSLVARSVEGKPEEHWFVGYRFDDRDGGYPLIDELDKAAGGRPAFIYRRCAQMGFANSAALAAIGFSSATQDPPFGRIERDASGKLTGLLRARAAHMMIEHIQADYTSEDFHRGLIGVFDEYLSYGVTSVQNSLTQTQAIRAYQNMRDAGELKLRVGMLVTGRDDDLVKAVIRSGLRSGFGDEWLRLIGVEWVGDGSTSGRTAAYHEPYVGQPVLGEPPNNRGTLLLDRAEHTRRVTEAHLAGLLVCTDAMGDRGIEHVLDIYEDVLAAHPRADHRLRIEHCCAVTPANRERLKRSRIVCSSAAGFAWDLGDAHIDNRGEAAMKYMWPHRAMIDDGVMAPAHSDAPVCTVNPFAAMSALVNRKTRSGRSIDASEAISVYEALQAYTTLGAWSGREEAIKGDLGLGKLADMCLLDRDPFEIPRETLSEVVVTKTIVGGDVMFDRAAVEAA